MTRKTKVRIVGAPELSGKILAVLVQHFEFDKPAELYERAVGRDYSHSNAEGVTIYIGIKKPKPETRPFAMSPVEAAENLEGWPDT